MVIVTLFIAGVVAIWVGIRGRRLDDHPLCQRCGFDLTGRPETSLRCSECGADLTLPRAIRVGHRRRRVGVTCGGGLLMASGVFAALVILGPVDWMSRAPVWWLARQIKPATSSMRERAAVELRRRLLAGTLDAAQVDWVSVRILDVQGDAQATWTPALGGFMESARTSGRLADERWQQYGAQAPGLSLHLRRRMRQGDPLVFALGNDSDRVASSSTLLFAQFSNSVLKVGDVRHEMGRLSDHGMLSVRLSTAPPQPRLVPEHFLMQLSPGVHTLRLKLDVGVCSVATMDLSALKPFATSSRTFEATFELLPPDQPSVKVRSDENLRYEVEESLRDVRVARGIAGRDIVEVLVRPNRPPPVTLVYKLSLHDGEREMLMGTLTCRPGSSSSGWKLSRELPYLRAAKVDVIFTPSIDAAVRTLDVDEIWNGKIRFKDVRVSQRR